MRRLLALGLTTVALSGCGLPTEPASPGERWIRGDTPEGLARLELGARHTGDLRVRMTCRPHEGAVDVTVMGRPGDAALIELHSGQVWNRYMGAGHPSDETPGEVDVDLKLAAADPMLDQLAATGQLTVMFGARRTILPNAFAPAHDFLAVCRLPG